MCGITGFFTPFRCDFRAIIEAMTEAIAHRGPDDRGTWADPQIGLAFGQTRLSIVDLSTEGHQPMFSQSGRFVIVFNGEAYNFLDIRRTLEDLGHQFRGHSDTEVILAAVEKWGIENTLPKINGMFAIALWDRQEKILHFVRDRLGVKPLYLGLQNGLLLFGSELRAITKHPKFARKIDLNSVTALMKLGFIPSPLSIYQDVMKLPPGTLLSIPYSSLAEGKLRMVNLDKYVKQYWSLKDVIAKTDRLAKTGSSKPLSFDEATKQLHDLLTDSIKLRMIADVPVGAFLSGGIDSSLVVALMQKQSLQKVKTFTIGFGEQLYDERAHAQAIAAHLGTDHTELVISDLEARELVPDLPSLFDEPIADASQIPTYFVSRLARKQVTVSLSGDGGDELFMGYNRYHWPPSILNRTRHIPTSILQVCRHLLSCLSEEQWNRLFCMLPASLQSRYNLDKPGERFAKLARVITNKDEAAVYQILLQQWEDTPQIVRNNFFDTGISGQVKEYAGTHDFRKSAMLFDQSYYLPDDLLAKLDRASMAVALEAREPLLDYRIVEFAALLPANYSYARIKGKPVTKLILKNILETYLPRDLWERPKMGFSVPVGAWLRGELRGWAEELLDESKLKTQGYLNVTAIRSAWTDHLSGRVNNQSKLWHVLMFQAWLEKTGSL